MSEKVSKSSLFETVSKLQSQFPVKSICNALGIPRSSFYASQQPKISKRAKENKIIKEHIQRIFDQSKGRYGAPKIHEVMKKEQLLKVIPSLKRIQRFMKSLGLFAVVFKKFRPQSSKPQNQDLPNLLEQDFKAERINEKWVADITYIYTIQNGWCYLV